jgi:hypothetical protein
LHGVAGANRAQLPLMHISPAAHTFPQFPQFSGSVFWLTQATLPGPVGQASGVGSAQPPVLALHAPPWHIWVFVQM